VVITPEGRRGRVRSKLPGSLLESTCGSVLESAEEDKVIVEVKSVELLAPVHKKQLLTYLRLADKRLGLLINFQVALIKNGIFRIVNGLEEDSHAKPPSRKGE